MMHCNTSEIPSILNYRLSIIHLHAVNPELISELFVFFSSPVIRHSHSHIQSRYITLTLDYNTSLQ